MSDRLDVDEVKAYLAQAKRARGATPDRYPADFDWATDVLQQVLAEVERLRGQLARLEHAHEGDCPACFAVLSHNQPHDEDCWLAAELGKAP